VKKNSESPAMQLVRLVWDNCQQVIGHSWTRLNQSMRNALNLAISGGLRFDLGDFKTIEKAFDMRYWGGEDGGFAEYFYSQAIAVQNLTACRSFEAWKDRPAFIVDGVQPRYGRVSRVRCRQRGRAGVGTQFPWRGELVKVTSFALDGSHLVACSYHPRTVTDPYTDKIRRRYRITIADIRADRKKRRDNPGHNTSPSEPKPQNAKEPMGCTTAVT